MSTGQTGQVDGKKPASGASGPVNKEASGGVTGSFSKGKTNSTYASVTEQAGIYAGKEGFDIKVGKNTDLKGAVISSEATPDKNKLSTDTLTYSDIKNKAEYSASSVGVNVNTTKDAKYNEKGITPDIGVAVKGDAASTTKSAISPGTIEVRSNPNQDLSKLSRDPAGAVNALGKIFDKAKVQEKQELAKVFGQEAFKAVGDLASSQRKKALEDAAKLPQDSKEYKEAMARAASWEDGGANKILLHSVVGGIMSSVGGNGFASGAVSAGVNEAVQKELAKIKDTGLHQLASALVGAAAAKVVGGNAQAGAAAAASGTKNNWLDHTRQEYYANKLRDALDNGDLIEANKIIKEAYGESATNAGYLTLDEGIESRDNDGAGLLEELQRYANATSQTLTDKGLNLNLANFAAYGYLQVRVPSNFNTTQTAAVKDKINQTPADINSILNQGGTWNSSGQLVGSDGTVYTNLPGRGNYAYSQGVQPTGYYAEGRHGGRSFFVL
ncbi:hypothetical protein [Sporomusa acidovorans]|uniref:Filamentous hemagglutinin n=1 Tax=Sporomusa acidovorans (strain ATCC 49682 / DSM 3132 / Mol) TaxID=1123286 RepID=A0ABZ3J5A1_SPOA4|nr:hypothetical protein [Sporomusa acidovorans]OZC14912.1 hypothetical protein SPACI_51860 [Sporomusa acidovorans DSM 3132]SDF87158.1 Possible hemagglutinin [Sporomusa acidovorans]